MIRHYTAYVPPFIPQFVDLGCVESGCLTPFIFPSLNNCLCVFCCCRLIAMHKPRNGDENCYGECECQFAHGKLQRAKWNGKQCPRFYPMGPKKKPGGAGGFAQGVAGAAGPLHVCRFVLGHEGGRLLAA